MKYIVKMRQTIIKEHIIEFNDDVIDDAVHAMILAEATIQFSLSLSGSIITIKETEWSPVSVTTKESSD